MEEIVHGRYKLLRKLGSGGTGEVYKALDLRLKRNVAIKRILPEKRGKKRVLGRLQKEAEYLAMVEHTNVVLVHDIVDSRDTFSIIMELVNGVPFIRAFRRRPMPEAQYLGYLRQILAANKIAIFDDVGISKINLSISKLFQRGVLSGHFRSRTSGRRKPKKTRTYVI